MVEKLLKIVQVKIPTVANLSTQAQYVQIWVIPIMVYHIKAKFYHVLEILDFVLNRLYRYGLRPFKNGSGRNPHSGKFAHPAQYVQIWAWPETGVTQV